MTEHVVQRRLARQLGLRVRADAQQRREALAVHQRQVRAQRHQSRRPDERLLRDAHAERTAYGLAGWHHEVVIRHLGLLHQPREFIDRLSRHARWYDVFRIKLADALSLPLPLQDGVKVAAGETILDELDVDGDHVLLTHVHHQLAGVARPVAALVALVRRQVQLVRRQRVLLQLAQTAELLPADVTRQRNARVQRRFAHVESFVGAFS